MKIGFLLFPHLTQLDLTGPAQVFAAAPGAELYYVWKTVGPVATDATVELVANATFESCPAVDILCVPGGPGQPRVMSDPDVLGWLGRQGRQAKWVVSVCSGSLLLGAAGLLGGYRAACHWNYRDHLAAFGATACTHRVVRDRNRITGGGVTAGIDIALEVVALVWGPNEAQQIQLLLEYAPEPRFDCGRPELAGDALTHQVRERLVQQVASFLARS